MGIKSFLLTVTALVLSTSVNAAIISTDWHTSGDKLITTDTESGLNWLDLTETNGLSYNYVSSQLGVGGQFEGFRFATTDEAVALWANWSVNLADGAPSSAAGLDLNVQAAAGILGNIHCELDCTYYPSGVFGLTAEEYGDTYHVQLGAYVYTTDTTTTTAYWNATSHIQSNLASNVATGSYLVTTVPVPAAAWLFGSGLLGLIGVARRKVKV